MFSKIYFKYIININNNNQTILHIKDTYCSIFRYQINNQLFLNFIKINLFYKRHTVGRNRVISLC